MTFWCENFCKTDFKMLTFSYAGLPALLGNVDPMGFVDYLPAWVPVGWLLFTFVIWFVAQWFARKALAHSPHKKAVAGWLRHPRYTQLYHWACKPLVDRVWAQLCDDSVPKTAGWRAQFKGAMSWRLYDKALLIAVLYPITTAFGYWLWSGKTAAIGAATIFAAAPNPIRLFTLGPLAILLCAIWLERHLISRRRKREASIAGETEFKRSKLRSISVFLAGAFASIFSGEGIIALTIAFAGPLSFAFADARRFAFAFSGAGAVAGAVIAATILAVASAKFYIVYFAISGSVIGSFLVCFAGVFAALNKVSARLFLLLHALSVFVLISGLVWLLQWSNFSSGEKSLFVFLGVLPLINGMFDWVSYGVTLSLLRRGRWAERPFLWGLLDLIIACALFLLLGITLVAVLHGLDQLAGGDLVDLPALLSGVYALKHGDWSQSWALFMVFSTMLPTGLHMLVSLIGLQGLWPAPWRRKLAGCIDVDDPSPLSQALLPMVLGLVWAAPIVAGCAALSALIQWGKPLLWGFFEGYFVLLILIAHWGGVV